MATPARTDALDVIVELLRELDRDPDSGGRGFYDSLCTALCNLAGMDRAGLLLYDDARQLVVPVGSHQLEPALLENIYGTLEETPIAQVALSEDRVVAVTGDLSDWIPERYAEFTGVETLTCTPVSAGGRWLGVIFADRGGGRFELSDADSHTMWTLGKTAALALRNAASSSSESPARSACIASNAVCIPPMSATFSPIDSSPLTIRPGAASIAEYCAITSSLSA